MGSEEQLYRMKHSKEFEMTVVMAWKGDYGSLIPSLSIPPSSTGKRICYITCSYTDTLLTGPKTLELSLCGEDRERKRYRDRRNQKDAQRAKPHGTL